MQTIEDEWIRYRKAVYRPDITRHQYKELRRTFYSGFGVALTTIDRMTQEQYKGEFMENYDKLTEEFMRFAESQRKSNV